VAMTLTTSSGVVSAAKSTVRSSSSKVAGPKGARRVNQASRVPQNEKRPRE
jgi:hypothetical protein